MHVIAAKGQCFYEALQPSFKEYQNQVLKNIKILSETLKENGFRIISDGTENHLILVDVKSIGLTGKETEQILDKINITCNKNTIPYDEESPMVTSGIRIGSPAMTTRGLKEKEFKQIGEIITSALKNSTEENSSKPTASFKKNPNIATAQKAFLNNLNRFVPLLNSTKIDQDKWSDAVIDVNDEDLTALWYKMINRLDLWVNQMAAWGLKQERCESFMAMDKHSQLYSTASGLELTIGQKYVVKSPCWLLTTQDENGHAIKKVVKKGIVELA